MQRVTLISALLVAVASQAFGAGLRVWQNNIVDSAGQGFVMRGINYPHSWYKYDAEKAIPAMAATGANTIRIVLSDGGKYNYDDENQIKRLLDLCAAYKMVAVLEVHDATGSDDFQPLQRAAWYWISMAPILQGREDKVIINIANEWIGTGGMAASWAQSYASIIPQLRAAGLNHLILVDAPGWGQDASAIPLKGGEVLWSDPQKNVAFAVHMYEVAGKDDATVKHHIDSAMNAGLALIIGEFSNAQNGHPVAYKSIMNYCDQRNVGWLAWSWYGNNADTANMDMAYSMGGGLTPLGQELAGRIGSTSRKANANW